MAAVYDHADTKAAFKQVEDIYFTLTEIFERAKQEGRATNEVAEKIALERLR